MEAARDIPYENGASQTFAPVLELWQGATYPNGRGHMVENPGMGGDWEEMFASHIRDKQAGPLTCPICGQKSTFEPKGTICSTLVDDVQMPSVQFGYAVCSNCGYCIFFDTEITGLHFS
jgi:predicted nucleic-acid-binding Zn-ribbon protein